MVADWSLRLQNAFGAGGVEAIKGNIGAVPAFTGIVVFRRSDQDQNEMLGDPRQREWSSLLADDHSLSGSCALCSQRKILL
jgi:hypothetical protein